MRRFFNRRNKIGFTLIELIVVIAIAAIVFAIGMIYWRKATVGRQFDTDFDKLVELLRSAKAMAGKYGEDPTNFQGAQNATNNKSYDQHYVRLVVNGLSEGDQEIVLKNAKISYANSDEALGGMAQTLIDDDSNNDFKGVAVLFGSKNNGAYTYDSSILYCPDGSLCYTPFTSPPSNNEIKITMESTDGSKKGEIVIDRNTGIIRPKKIK